MKRLPDEVWVLIIDGLEIPIDKIPVSRAGRLNKPVRERLTALSSLCRTSSRLEKLARPVLYRNLPASIRNVQGALLSTIHQHPQLAQHVETVNLGEGIRRWSELTMLVILPYYHHPQIRDGPRPALLQKAYECSSGVKDIWFAHWVMLLPNLKLLECAPLRNASILPLIIQCAAQKEPEGVTRGDKSVGDETTESSTPAPLPQEASLSTLMTALSYTPLSKLEEFRIHTSDPDEVVCLRDYQELFLLPRLRTFRGNMVELNTTLAHQESSSQPPPRQSMLRHAYFEESLADPEGLEDLLQSCPCLQTLRMGWAPEHWGENILNFAHIGTVFREYGAELEVLDLNCQEASMYGAGHTEGYIGSLRGLHRLKHLSVQQDILLRSDVREETDTDPVVQDGLESLLPDCLESLNLYNYHCGKCSVEAGVQGILSSQRLVRLRTVQVHHKPGMALECDFGGWASRKCFGFVVFDR